MCRQNMFPYVYFDRQWYFLSCHHCVNKVQLVCELVTVTFELLCKQSELAENNGVNDSCHQDGEAKVNQLVSSSH